MSIRNVRLKRSEWKSMVWAHTYPFGVHGKVLQTAMGSRTISKGEVCEYVDKGTIFRESMPRGIYPLLENSLYRHTG